ncbi:hypothetical protein C8R47DRAFT_1072199 [Mycena vitilis]|nr:hypothetical protein C8R47DRAFT_1072199 [Mycena vitilis]
MLKQDVRRCRRFHGKKALSMNPIREFGKARKNEDLHLRSNVGSRTNKRDVGGLTMSRVSVERWNGRSWNSGERAKRTHQWTVRRITLIYVPLVLAGSSLEDPTTKTSRKNGKAVCGLRSKPLRDTKTRTKTHEFESTLAYADPHPSSSPGQRQSASPSTISADEPHSQLLLPPPWPPTAQTDQGCAQLAAQVRQAASGALYKRKSGTSMTPPCFLESAGLIFPGPLTFPVLPLRLHPAPGTTPTISPALVSSPECGECGRGGTPCPTRESPPPVCGASGIDTVRVVTHRRWQHGLCVRSPRLAPLPLRRRRTEVDPRHQAPPHVLGGERQRQGALQDCHNLPFARVLQAGAQSAATTGCSRRTLVNGPGEGDEDDPEADEDENARTRANTQHRRRPSARYSHLHSDPTHEHQCGVLVSVLPEFRCRVLSRTGSAQRRASDLDSSAACNIDCVGMRRRGELRYRDEVREYGSTRVRTRRDEAGAWVGEPVSVSADSLPVSSADSKSVAAAPGPAHTTARSRDAGTAQEPQPCPSSCACPRPASKKPCIAAQGRGRWLSDYQGPVSDGMVRAGNKKRTISCHPNTPSGAALLTAYCLSFVRRESTQKARVLGLRDSGVDITKSSSPRRRDRGKIIEVSKVNAQDGVAMRVAEIDPARPLGKEKEVWVAMVTGGKLKNFNEKHETNHETDKYPITTRRVCSMQIEPFFTPFLLMAFYGAHEANRGAMACLVGWQQWRAITAMLMLSRSAAARAQLHTSLRSRGVCEECRGRCGGGEPGSVRGVRGRWRDVGREGRVSRLRGTAAGLWHLKTVLWVCSRRTAARGTKT